MRKAAKMKFEYIDPAIRKSVKVLEEQFLKGQSFPVGSIGRKINGEKLIDFSTNFDTLDDLIILTRRLSSRFGSSSRDRILVSTLPGNVLVGASINGHSVFSYHKVPADGAVEIT